MTDTTRLAAAFSDRYMIERELGQGGMATVYLAQDLKHGRKVAIKILRSEVSSALGPERFLREIEIVAGLHHPHILPLYDSGEAGGFLYYVMPVAEGESLRHRIDRERQLPVDDALRIAREVADALDHAHRHDVVHRDIKPENILLQGGHAIVADFGIAKAISAAGKQTLTGFGFSIGSPEYMSPEQAAGEQGVDGRSDVYALGCVLFEMLAGQPPFSGPTTESIVRQHMAVEAPSVTGIRPAVPAPVAAAIRRALVKAPADRFSSASQFAAALEGREVAGTRGRGARRAAVAGAVVGVVFLVWQLVRPADAAITFANIRQVTRERGLEIQAAVSPDGRELAYTSGYPGSMHIEVRDISGGRARSLTGDWVGSQVQPQWTPDGSGIRFVNVLAAPDHAAGAWIVPRMGGAGVAVDRDSAPQRLRADIEARGDSVFARAPDGNSTLLYAGPPQQFHSAAWSPDGSRVAFVIGNFFYQQPPWGNVGPSAIWVATLGSAPVRVTDDTRLNVSPVWLADGRLLFVSDRDGPRDVYAVRPGRAGQAPATPVRLTTGLEAYSVSVSADGRAAAYDRFLFRRNIYSLPIPGSGSVSIRAAQPLTTQNQVVELLSISRDGRWLTFDSNLDGNQDIYVMPATGGEPRRVTRDPGSDFGPDFSPDGGEITFYSSRNGNRDIHVVRADGTGEQRLTSDAAESYGPRFAPDGLRIVYFTPFDSTRMYLLRRRSLTEAWGGPELMAMRGNSPRWSPDGTQLVYNRSVAAGSGIVVATTDGPERTLIEPRAGGLQGLRAASWSADGRRVYFIAIAPGGARGLYQIPKGGGVPSLLVRFDDPAMDVFAGFGVGNGRFYFAIGEMESDIYVMDLVRR